MIRLFFLIVLFLMNSSLIFSQDSVNYEIIDNGCSPSFSPNGKYIAYQNKGNIWIIDLKTKVKRKVTNLINDVRPQWSPDNKKIIFQSYGDSKTNVSHSFSIWIVNIDGSDQHQFYQKADRDGGDQTPHWSPDGKKIAWTHGRQIWIANTNSKNAKPLTKNPAIEYEYIVDWSKDSKTIMYLKCDKYISGTPDYISFVDTNGNNQKSINPMIYTNWAKFSKDGKSLYFIYREVRYLKMADSSLESRGFENYLFEYNFSNKEIIKNKYKIENIYFNGLNQFELSPDFEKITYDDTGPETAPKVYIMKLN